MKSSTVVTDSELTCNSGGRLPDTLAIEKLILKGCRHIGTFVGRRQIKFYQNRIFSN